ncbi:glycosyltransferase family 22 protein [Xylariaceae sp. FL0016]|nr:glycosyltransferase family 22 protein [Xylariaceae sp. FL0016]
MSPPRKSDDKPHITGAKGVKSERPSENEVASMITTQARESLAVVFAFRVVNVLCIRTFFQPDEYFQALEPAWQMVYGENSGAWLTWEWRHQLRSSLHPAILALGYYIVESFWASYNVPMVKAKWLLVAPRIIQTGFAALGDWYTWRLAEKLYGPSSTAAWSVLLMTLLNPWQWYTATRTFSNCLETTLTAAALYYFPWELLGVETEKKNGSKQSLSIFETWAQVNSLRLALISAAFAVLLRPTNIIIWLSVATLTITRATLGGRSPLTRGVLLIAFREVIVCGSIVLGLSLLVDRQYFGDWTFPPFTFLHFNVAQDLAIFYGENDWHYYLSQGIPLLCTTITPFALKGLTKSLDAERSWPVVTSNALKTLTFTVITNIASLSLVSHKEVRFIAPLLPALHIIAAPHVTSFFTTAYEAATTCPPPALGWKRKPLLAAGVIVNIVIGGYLASFHAAAPISVMGFLRKEFEETHPNILSFPRPANATDEDLPQELFALFLTPCHATPWRSHLVYPTLRARALTCEPPIDTPPKSAERAAYQDETRRFYADPVAYLTTTLWPRDAPGEDMARYIVGYEGIESALREYFDWSGPGARHKIQLREVWRSWNGLFTDDERKAGELKVWATGFYDDEGSYEP